MTSQLPKLVPEQRDGISSHDFILWLNGVVDLLDSTPPTQVQWDLIRAKTADQVACIVRKRINELTYPPYVVTGAQGPAGPQGISGTTTTTSGSTSLSILAQRSLAAAHAYGSKVSQATQDPSLQVGKRGVL